MTYIATREVDTTPQHTQTPTTDTSITLTDW